MSQHTKLWSLPTCMSYAFIQVKEGRSRTEGINEQEGTHEKWKLNDFLCSVHSVFPIENNDSESIQQASQFGSQNWELKETTTYLYEHDIINISLKMSKCHSNCNDVKVSICNIFIHSLTSIYLWLYLNIIINFMLYNK